MGLPKMPEPSSAGMPPPSVRPPSLGSVSPAAALKVQKASSQNTMANADKTIQTTPQGIKPPSTATATLLGR